MSEKTLSQGLDESSEAPFQGLELHCVGYFPINFLDRYEDYETTLNLFEVLPKFGDNINVLNRPTYVFRNSPTVFEQLRQKAIEDTDFIDVKIIEKYSDLGLSCYFYAKHKLEEEVFFDGIIFRITSKLINEEFHLKDVASLMDYPNHPKAIQSLSQAIKKVKPDFPENYCSRRFYTALKTNWNLLKIKAFGEPSMCLTLDDPNYLTITALKYVESEKKYNFYIGNYRKILQLIAHDFYQCNEIESLRKYILLKIKKARECFQLASAAFTVLSQPFWYLRLKFESWSKAKKGFIYLLQELPLLYRYALLVEAYEKVAEDKLSSINEMRQIFIFEDEYDNSSAIAQWEKNFFPGVIENNQIFISSEVPLSPDYTDFVQFLKSDVTALENAVQESFTLNKDLLASAQTEFSAYSIWLAITAIVISAILGIIPILCG